MKLSETSFSETIEMKKRIISWFEGTERAIKDPENIINPVRVGNMITFQHDAQFCECPYWEKREGEFVSLYEEESWGANMLRMSISHRVEKNILNEMVAQ